MILKRNCFGEEMFFLLEDFDQNTIRSGCLLLHEWQKLQILSFCWLVCTKKFERDRIHCPHWKDPYKNVSKVWLWVKTKVLHLYVSSAFDFLLLFDLPSVFWTFFFFWYRFFKLLPLSWFSTAFLTFYGFFDLLPLFNSPLHFFT